MCRKWNMSFPPNILETPCHTFWIWSQYTIRRLYAFCYIRYWTEQQYPHSFVKIVDLSNYLSFKLDHVKRTIVILLFASQFICPVVVHALARMPLCVCVCKFTYSCIEFPSKCWHVCVCVLVYFIFYFPCVYFYYFVLLSFMALFIVETCHSLNDITENF